MGTMKAVISLSKIQIENVDCGGNCDEYGRLIARIDYNAPNPAAGISSTLFY